MRRARIYHSEFNEGDQDEIDSSDIRKRNLTQHTTMKQKFRTN